MKPLQTSARPPRVSPSTTLATLAALMGLVACATPPGNAPAPTAAPVPVSAPAPAPAYERPAPPPAEPPAPASPSAVQAAQRLALGAADLLENGNEEQATVELQRALQSDPNNKLAQSLLKQVQGDPQQMLGRESFAYRVQPGESLSRIAQRFLGDVHQFYILARYNDLRVPRQLQGGQMIKIPGKAPAAGTAAPVASPSSSRPPAAPAPAAVASPAPAATPAAPAPSPAAVSADKAERDRQARIATATRAARSAFARQDLAAAIKSWDSVLEIDPGNQTAQLERQRAIDLRERLSKVK